MTQQKLQNKRVVDLTAHTRNLRLLRMEYITFQNRGTNYPSISKRFPFIILSHRFHKLNNFPTKQTAYNQ